MKEKLKQIDIYFFCGLPERECESERYKKYII